MTQRHRQIHLDDVAILPGAMEFYKTARLAGGGEGLAVDRHRRLGAPGRVANVHGHRGGRGGLNLQTRFGHLREWGGLREGQIFLLPREGRGDEEVDVQFILSVVEINGVAVFGVVFNARAGAAPEGIEGRAIKFWIARPDGLEIRHHAIVRVLRREDAIVEGEFVEIGVGGGGILGKERARELEQVMLAAGFDGLGGGQRFRKIGRREKMLLLAMAAGDVRTRLHHRLPEKLRRRFILRLAGEFVEALEADEFRDLGIRVQLVQCVFGLGQRVEHGVVDKAFRERQVFGMAGEDIGVGQHFIHAAVFRAEHALKLGVGHRGGLGFRPVAEFGQDVEGGGVVAEEVGIAEAGEDFVQGVPGHAGDAAAGDEVVELGLAVGKGADEAIRARGLAGLKFGDDIIGALPVHRIAGGGMHHGDGGEVMAESMAMAADVDPGLDGFPAAVHGGLGLESGVHAEIVQQAVRLELPEVFLVELLGMEKRAVEQADIGEGKGGDVCGDGALDFALGAGGGGGSCRRGRGDLGEGAEAPTGKGDASGGHHL